MKIKSYMTLTAVVTAGLLASGCSQMAAQQLTPPPPAPLPPPPVEKVMEPEIKVVERVRTIVDCSKCKRPAPAKPRPVQRPRPAQGGAHTHPAIPNCTDSIRHTHPFTNRNHKHRYVCTKGVRRPAPRPVVRPRPAPKPVMVKPQPRPQFGHVHPAIPRCTDSIRHNHRFTNPNHKHRYACTRGRRPAQPPRQIVRPVQPPRPQFGHVHPAIPRCTDSIRHNHRFSDPNHRHSYSCTQGRRPVAPAPIVPIKPKGTYRGPVQIDSGVMSQYQQ